MRFLHFRAALFAGVFFVACSSPQAPMPDVAVEAAQSEAAVAPDTLLESAVPGADADDVAIVDGTVLDTGDTGAETSTDDGIAFDGAVLDTADAISDAASTSDVISTDSVLPPDVSCSSGLMLCGSSCVDTQRDLNNCGACNSPCTTGMMCVAGACLPTCAAPMPDQCGSGAMAVCTNLQTDPMNCGSCGARCGANANCARSACSVRNDTPTTAITLDATMTNVQQSTSGSLAGATTDTGHCAGTTADVYYQITVTQRSLLYVDTFGSAANTSLGVRAMASAATTQCTNNSCATQQEQLALVVNPGTTFLEVALAGGSATTFTLHWSVTPLGGGTATLLTPTATTQTVLGNTLPGSTPAPSAYTPSCGAAGTPSGPEDAYYFLTCPSHIATNLHVSTCGGPSNTVVEARSAGQMPSCNDDGGYECGVGSSTNHTVPSGPGAHVVYVDSASAATAGRYRLYYALGGCNNAHLSCGGVCRMVSSLATDNANCGRCGIACAPGVSCTSGACDPGVTCTSGQCTGGPDTFVAWATGATATTTIPGTATSPYSPTSCAVSNSAYTVAGINPVINYTMGTGGILTSSGSSFCADISPQGTPSILTTTLTRGAFSCPAGTLWTGIRGRSAIGELHQLSFRCSRFLVTGTGPYRAVVDTSEDIYTHILGGDGGTPFPPIDCPPGQFVFRFDRSGTGEIELQCAGVNTFRATFDTTLTRYGGLIPAGSTGGSVFIDDCPPGQMMGGVRATFGSFGLSALGVLCGYPSLVGSIGATQYTLHNSATTLLPLRGVSGFTPGVIPSISLLSGLAFYLNGGTIMGLGTYGTQAGGYATIGGMIFPPYLWYINQTGGSTSYPASIANCTPGYYATGLETHVVSGISQVGVRCTGVYLR